jgi:hypothetical protein
VIAFGLEAAAVLAKVTSHVPTTYSGLLAKNSFMQGARMADDMTAELKAMEDRQRPVTAPPPSEEPSSSKPDVDTPPDPGEDRPNGADHAADLFGDSTPPVPQPPKRGRPRKSPPSAGPATGANGPEDSGPRWSRSGQARDTESDGACCAFRGPITPPPVDQVMCTPPSAACA